MTARKEAENRKNLKGLGLKVTRPRLKILNVFEQAQKRHLSAEEIFEQLRHSNNYVPLATVYRVLNQFETAGIVTRLRFDQDQALYELEDKDHHDHMICIHCGKVEEFYDALIEERQQQIAVEKGATIVDHSLCIYITCAACQQHNQLAGNTVES